MAAHTALGYVLAVGVAGAGQGVAGGAAFAGLVLWVLCLNGGTLAINSAFDQDEGDIAYLRRPPPPPRHLFAFGLALMLAGLAGAAALPLAYLAAYAICFAMSVAYSVPPMRLKAVAGADWVINMLGFGTLTPVAGWAATGRPFDATHAIVLAGFCPLFAALYPLTQLYQLEEDARRGDRTLAVRLGVVTSLSVAIAAAAVAFALLTLAAIRSAWPTTGGAAWRWAALCAAAAAWAAVLVPWRIRARSLGPPEHQRGMYWALGAWALTDLAVAAVWAT